MKYTKNWTRKDFIKFRKLKRRGYTNDELLEHFGDVLYEDTGVFNRNGNFLVPVYLYNKGMERIRKTPEKTDCSIFENDSPTYKDKKNYESVIKSYANGRDYYIRFDFNEINDIETYDLMFLTLLQSMDINTLDLNEEKESNFENGLYSIICNKEYLKDLEVVIKNLVFALNEFSNEKNIKTFSVKDIGNEKMLNLYKKIIYQTFDNVIECYVNSKEFKGYIFNIYN